MSFRYAAVGERSRLLRIDDLDRVAGALTHGSLAVLPTETGYMLAALATSPTALQAAFRVKQRDPAHVMHVACSSLAMARQFARIDDRAARALGAFTPGPLSVVVPQTDRLPASLVTRDGTVGIRVPDVPATLQVIAAVGAPLTATSLNVSGGGTVTIDDAGLGRWTGRPARRCTWWWTTRRCRTRCRPPWSACWDASSNSSRPGPVTLDAIEAVLAGLGES